MAFFWHFDDRELAVGRHKRNTRVVDHDALDGKVAVNETHDYITIMRLKRAIDD